jgi:hypothetical protein
MHAAKRETEYFGSKTPSTDRIVFLYQTVCCTPDEGSLCSRNRGIILDKQGVLAKCDTFHTQNVKRFTFFPQARSVSPGNLIWRLGDLLDRRKKILTFPFAISDNSK